MAENDTTPARRIVDAHVHWWDPTQPWMLMATQEEADELRMGDISPMVAGPYLGDDYRRDAQASGVDKVVWVMATGDPAGHDAEVAWIRRTAEGDPLLAAIIGSVDPGLTRDDRLRSYAEQSSSPLFRGVRVIGELDYASPVADDYQRMLADGGHVFDHMGHHGTMLAAARLAERHPDVPWVLEHCGWPLHPDDPAYVAAWREGITALASVGTVHCKLSGLAMATHSFDLAAQQPFLEHCYEAFGPERCLFGSNFPVDRLHGSFDALLAMFDAFVAGLGDVDAHQLYAGNAERVYRLA